MTNVDILRLRGVDICSQTGLSTPLSTPVTRPSVYQGPERSDWLATAHASFPLRFVRPPSYILDEEALKNLTRALPTSIRSATAVTELLHQTPEWHGMWAEGIHKVFGGYKPGEVAQVFDDTDESPAKRARHQ
jgi:hypothetical protein